AEHTLVWCGEGVAVPDVVSQRRAGWTATFGEPAVRRIVERDVVVIERANRALGVLKTATAVAHADVVPHDRIERSVISLLSERWIALSDLDPVAVGGRVVEVVHSEQDAVLDDLVVAARPIVVDSVVRIAVNDAVRNDRPGRSPRPNSVAVV